jgi:hypothetical protein
MASERNLERHLGILDLAKNVFNLPMLSCWALQADAAVLGLESAFLTVCSQEQKYFRTDSSDDLSCLFWILIKFLGALNSHYLRLNRQLLPDVPSVS